MIRSSSDITSFVWLLGAGLEKLLQAWPLPVETEHHQSLVQLSITVISTVPLSQEKRKRRFLWQGFSVYNWNDLNLG